MAQILVTVLHGLYGCIDVLNTILTTLFTLPMSFLEFFLNIRI